MRAAMFIVLCLLAADKAQADSISSPNAFGIVPTDAGETLRFRRCTNADLETEARIAACRQLVKDKGVESDAAYILAQIYLEKNDIVAARDIYDRMVAAAGDEAGPLLLRGALQAAIGDYDDAMKDADAAFRTGHDKDEALAGRCFIRAVANRELDAALADCDAALADYAKDIYALDARGFVLFRMGRMADAIIALSAAIDRDRHDAMALYLRGLAQRAQGDASNADADIDAANRIDPHIAALLKRYGVNTP